MELNGKIPTRYTRQTCKKDSQSKISVPVIQAVTKACSAVLIVLSFLLPGYLIAHLFFFQDPGLEFGNHTFHEIAIAAATLDGLFITYVTWRRPAKRCRAG
ncbi:hypothetical protein CS8_002220 [Cupriavidus sp. 8B]